MCRYLNSCGYKHVKPFDELCIAIVLANRDQMAMFVIFNRGRTMMYVARNEFSAERNLYTHIGTFTITFMGICKHHLSLCYDITHISNQKNVAYVIIYSTTVTVISTSCNGYPSRMALPRGIHPWRYHLQRGYLARISTWNTRSHGNVLGRHRCCYLSQNWWDQFNTETVAHSKYQISHQFKCFSCIPLKLGLDPHNEISLC